MRRLALLVSLPVLIVGIFSAPAFADKRVALVVGNSAYVHAGVLPNPANDASDVGTTLKEMGFDVVLGLDLDKRGFDAKVRDFSKVLTDAEAALFYYAGHGLQVAGRNHLVPIDAQLQNERDLDFEAVSLDLLMTTVEPAKKLRLVLLDACRDNPFARAMHRSIAQRSIGRGLASIEPDPGTVVVFAAKHGQIAYDGEKHSPFASALMKEITKPGIELRRLFDIVRDDVMETTHRQQQPFTYGSLPGHEDFIFAFK